MKFNEKFIDRNIAELCESYDKIKGVNTNIARIAPDLIDGLKPVQRRALYIMYLKDGGKSYRKLATISGEVFGRVHPHCLHGDTEFLLTNGTKRKISDLYKEGSNAIFEIMSYSNKYKKVMYSTMHNVRITKHVTELHEIKLTNGSNIKCTNDHRILVMRANGKKTKYHEDILEPIWVQAENLKSGDLLYSAEIDNLSFDGNDVGYPFIKLPYNSAISNDGGISIILHKYLKIDPRLKDKNYHIHHKDFNKNNFASTNLEVINNSDHNLLHMQYDHKRKEICLNALEQGRKLLRNHPEYIKKMKCRNSKYMKAINQRLPLFKAFKTLSIMIENNMELSNENYDIIRSNQYNTSSLESLCQKNLIDSPNIDSLYNEYQIKLNSSDYMGLYNPKQYESDNKSVIQNNRLIGSLLSSFKRVYSRNITSGLDIYDRNNYITGRHKTTHTNIWDRCVENGIDVDDLLNKLKYQFIQVESVNVIHYDTEIPLYDFTADPYHNGMICCGHRSDTSHSFVVVSNSPTSIEDAIVNIAQPWHNNIPLIDGEGNWGSCSGDVAGASRYIKARLSEYAIACFFEDWKDSVVDMTMGYDEETKMPLYLPAKYPNVLLNGCLGIGYGQSSNLPSFNFREVVEATIRLMADPNTKIILIPDSPTGADIIETDFGKLCDRGTGSYIQRCTYEIDDEHNIITITSTPDQISINNIREKIADIKENGGLAELINMNDLSGKVINLQLVIRDDVNPYKFMKKLISEVPGLEKSYPVNITVTNDYQSFDYSIKRLLLEWIKWRREQKRVVVSNKRTTLMAEQRINDVKIFIMNEKNLDETVKIFRTSRNRTEIENRLIDRYRNTEIHMDSLQARALSNMRMIELTIEAYESCLKRREELIIEIADIENILSTDNGVDKIIIAELRDGIKRFGKPRKSNVVPYKISISSEVDGACILQLSSDGMIIRKLATNVDEEPIPTDSNGFAVKVDNDSSFIIIDEFGNYSFIKAKELPVDTEVPVNRYMKKSLPGNIVAMLPYDIESNRSVTLISKYGVVKRIRIGDMGPSKRPCITLNKEDRVIRGITVPEKSHIDILVYTKNGMGQRLDPNSIRITSPSAKGGNGFKLIDDDEIVGCYAINPAENQYLLYTTIRAKMRLNNIEYLPIRESKHDAMVSLITLNERDKLLSVIGCNKLDKAQLFFGDNTSEIIDISKIEEGTMSTRPKKIAKKEINNNAMNVVKIKLV